MGKVQGFETTSVPAGLAFTRFGPTKPVSFDGQL